MPYNFQHSPYTQDRAIGDFLSITSAGRIGLSKQFLTTHGIQRGVRAMLYWDAGGEVLAIRFTDRADPTAYPVVFTKQYGGYVNGERFFRQRLLDPKTYAGRYAYTAMPGRDVGIFSISEVVFVVELKPPKTSASKRGSAEKQP
jgi:hypothetical protein